MSPNVSRPFGSRDFVTLVFLCCTFFCLARFVSACIYIFYLSKFSLARLRAIWSFEPDERTSDLRIEKFCKTLV